MTENTDSVVLLQPAVRDYGERLISVARNVADEIENDGFPFSALRLRLAADDLEKAYAGLNNQVNFKKSPEAA